MSKGKLKNLGAYYELEWEEHALMARVARLKQHSDGRLTCQLTLRTNDPDHYPHLTQQQLNLSSPTSRRSLRQTVEPRYKRKVPWDSVIEELCYLVTQEYTRGQPVEEIGGDDASIPDEAEWLIRPVIYKDAINVLYGDGGAGKSLLCAALAICVQLPFPENPLGLGVPDKVTNVLWLDYEGGKNSTHRNIKFLAKGFDAYPVVIPYRFGASAFVDEFEEIMKAAHERNTEVLILDAIGGAIGAQNMNDAQTATSLMNAIRTLNMTSILIHHVPKEDRPKGAFGSGYFTYQARNVWEVIKHQVPGSFEMDVVLRHKKCNWGNYQRNIGFHFSFEPGAIYVERMNPMDSEGLKALLPLKTQIATTLAAQGSMTVEAITAALPKADEHSVSRVLRRYRDTLFVQLPDKRWGRLQDV